MSLYHTLKIDEHATLDEIKAAHRKLVREHHPDAGGDEMVFRAIQGAYEILSDPEARKRYDETGEIDKPADTTDAEAILVIEGLVTELLTDEVDRGDAIAAMTAKIAAENREIDSFIDMTNKGIVRAERRQKRFRMKHEGKRNIIDNLIASKIKAAKESIGQAERRRVVLEAAKSILADYSFDVDPASNTAANSLYRSASPSSIGLGAWS